MKERFEPIVVPDAFEHGNGETRVRAVSDMRTASGWKGDVVVIELGGHRRVALKPEEAMKIGSALIAAANQVNPYS